MSYLLKHSSHLLLWLWLLSFASGAAGMRITFVGTGGPEVSLEREGIATLVTVEDQLILFDAGRNLMQNLFESGVDPRDLDRIILTHLHNDHIEGLPNLWMTGWFLLGRAEPLEVWGPPGTLEMVEGMYEMYQFDVQNRANAYNDPEHLRIKVTEIQGDGPLIVDGELVITAFGVEHDDGNPAFGYRVDTNQHSILLTGDTRLCPPLLKYGKDLDVIITNILAMPDELARKPEMQGVTAKLMTIPEAVELFRANQPRIGVYTHFVTKELPGDDVDSYIEKATRENGYSGALFLAKDGWSLQLPSLEILPPPSPELLPELDRKRSYEE